MGEELFSEGMSLHSIYFVSEAVLTITSEDVKSITVSMANGQMAPVPWAIVRYVSGLNTAWNLSMVEGVKFNG